MCFFLCVCVCVCVCSLSAYNLLQEFFVLYAWKIEIEWNVTEHIQNW